MSRLAPLVALACLALAGCGGGSPAQEPEQVLPASTSVLLHLDRGPRLAAAEALLGHVSSLPASFAAALAAVRLPPGKGPVFLARVPAGWVALLRPADPKAYAQRLGRRPVARIRGWTVVAAAPAALGEVRHARGRLAGRPSFRPPPGDALAGAWASPEAASALGFSPVRDRRWAEAALTEDALVQRQRGDSLGPSAPTTASRATTGAAFALGGGPWSPFSRVLPVLAEAYGLDGPAVGRALPPGAAIVLSPGQLIPSVTFVGAAPAAAAVAARLGTLLVRGATFGRETTIGGVPLHEYDLGAGTVFTGAWGRTFAAGIGSTGVLAARRGGADVGLPARTQGWVYVDREVADAAAAAFDDFAGDGVAQSLLAALGPIRHLVAWEAYDGRVESTTVIVRGR